jgi:hypothetical protein
VCLYTALVSGIILSYGWGGFLLFIMAATSYEAWLRSKGQ